MRWIALLIVAAALAIGWMVFVDGEPDPAVSESTSGELDQPADEAGALANPDLDAAAASGVDPAAADGVSQEVAATDPTTRPLALNDEVVTVFLPIDQSRAGIVGSAEPGAGSAENGSDAEGPQSSGSIVPQEIEGPGGDPIRDNEVGPGEAFAGSDIEAGPGQDSAALGPEFGDPVILAPEFEAVDVAGGGPGSGVTTEPLPGPGSDSIDTAGPGPGFDDPRTPPPTEPDGLP